MTYLQPPLLFESSELSPRHTSLASFCHELEFFRAFGKPTTVQDVAFDGNSKIQLFINEFWTSKQRAACSLHEISYRACFKPQLPRFFVERLTEPGAVVYDPFLGRGTTVIEAALLRRKVRGCDINPLSAILTKPRLLPPRVEDVRMRLADLNFVYDGEIDEELLAFYHPDTLREIYALRTYLLHSAEKGDLSDVDAWIRMVATNRLTGHSSGFFSVYTMPPNQAVSADRQRRINEVRKQTPPRRDVREVILKKTQTLLSDVTDYDQAVLRESGSGALFVTGSSDKTPEIENDSVDLVVTSPPFLDVVNYSGDNWLRCWFNGIDPSKIQIWTDRKPAVWSSRMASVFVELSRVLKPGGYVAFEVGEVRGGKVKMEELVIPAARQSRLEPVLVLINSQTFTKTANCWGVRNNNLGTNTNRVVLFQKTS